MIRMMTTVLYAVSLAACTNLPDWASPRQQVSHSDAHTSVTRHHFDWLLSGAPQVAPLQVFDDGTRTWLHFLPDQIVPAIFQSTEHGERLLPYVRQGEFLVIDGVWPVLSFRGGGLSASAHKRAQTDVIDLTAQVTILHEEVANHTVTSPVETVAVEVAPADSMTTSRDAPVFTPQVKVSDALKEAHPDHAIREDVATVPNTSDAVRLTDSSFDLLADSVYAVRLQDGTLRQTLHRWARRANWTFAPEHWAVGVDIPISGEADFSGSFQDAVQDALASTEFTDRPLRPCFYSNRVLRVVAYTQSCDRSGASTS